MRHHWIVALVVLGSAVGVYAAQSKSSAGADGLPMAVGDTITVIYNPGQDRECRIEEIRATFVRCQGLPRSTETWINMTQAAGFTKPSTR